MALDMRERACFLSEFVSLSELWSYDATAAVSDPFGSSLYRIVHFICQLLYSFCSFSVLFLWQSQTKASISDWTVDAVQWCLIVRVFCLCVCARARQSAVSAASPRRNLCQLRGTSDFSTLSASSAAASSSIVVGFWRLHTASSRTRTRLRTRKFYRGYVRYPTHFKIIFPRSGVKTTFICFRPNSERTNSRSSQQPSNISVERRQETK